MFLKEHKMILRGRQAEDSLFSCASKIFSVTKFQEYGFSQSRKLHNLLGK